MAKKFSENPILEYNQDWGNDTSNNLPYSGLSVLKFIKEELQKKPTKDETEALIKQLVTNTIFNNGENDIVVNVEGSTESLDITYLKSGSKTISLKEPDVTYRFIGLKVNVDKSEIKKGEDVALYFAFTISDYKHSIIEDAVDTKSTIRLAIFDSSSRKEVYSGVIGEFSANLEELSDASSLNRYELKEIISKYAKDDSSYIVLVKVEHSYTPAGDTIKKTISKASSVQLSIINLYFNPSIDIVNTGASLRTILYYDIKGNGSKTVSLYEDGKKIASHEKITSYLETKMFSFDVGATGNGRHNYQLIAEVKVGQSIIYSDLYYFDLFKNTNKTIISFQAILPNQLPYTELNYELPVFNVLKFNDFLFNYYVFNPSSISSNITIKTLELNYNNEPLSLLKSEQTLNRQLYSYTKRIKSSNRLKIEFIADGGETRSIQLNPLESYIDLNVPSDNIELNLDADGRSNNEKNPGVWKWGDYTTEFNNGFNWGSNGWNQDKVTLETALLFSNGAGATINFPLFSDRNITTTGCAFEITFKCEKATDAEHDIITCLWKHDGKDAGLKITTLQVGVITGEETRYEDDKGLITNVATNVGSFYNLNKYYKFIFVIAPKELNGLTKSLCYGYINGILSCVAEVPERFSNNRLNPKYITIDSRYADVYIKSIKYYNKPLTHNQCVDDYIINQNRIEDVEAFYIKNNIFMDNSYGDKKLSPQKIKNNGGGVMIISPAEGSTARILDLNTSTNKDYYYGNFRIDYYAPATHIKTGINEPEKLGEAFNFTHKKCAIRIQGTTSTKRPRKNYRLQLANIAKEGGSKGNADPNDFLINGKSQSKIKYAMSSNAVGVPILCLKTDYVDSSMTHNTGGATVFNELTKAISELHNPALKKEYENAGNNVAGIKTRVAIEGYPIDVFAASGINDSGEYSTELLDSRYNDLEYLGLYNFNNDKSKSGAVFGFDGSYTYNILNNDGTPTIDEDGNPIQYLPVCIEFLNNATPINLFQVQFNNDGTINDEATYNRKISDTKWEIATAIEVRAPADVTDHVEGAGLSDLATSDFLKDKEGRNTELSNKYKYIPDQIKRVFNFIGECVKEVIDNNNNKLLSGQNRLSYTKLNNWNVAGSAEYETTSQGTLNYGWLDTLDWTSSKFKKEASQYFNLYNVITWYLWTDYLMAVDQRAKNMMMYTMDGKHWMFLYYDGDTILGERNDCYLAYNYLLDREYFDKGASQFAFQGHDSWLWYLIRANFSEKSDLNEYPDTAINFASVGNKMLGSGKFSADYIKEIFNNQFVNRWSQRLYNYSLLYKYIDPLTDAVDYPSDIKRDYTNVAQGSRESHRNFLVENRFKLLNSKFAIGGYRDDKFVYATDNNPVDITIKSNNTFYFGYGTPNTGIVLRKLASAPEYTVTLNVKGAGTNNPADIYGASEIKELVLPEGRDWLLHHSSPIVLPKLEKIIARNISNGGGGKLAIDEKTTMLTDIDFYGFSGLSSLLGLTNCKQLTRINAKGTNVTSFEFAAGAPLKEVLLPSPSELKLNNIKTLTLTSIDTNVPLNDTLRAESWDNLSTLVIWDCDGINTVRMLDKIVENAKTWISDKLNLTKIVRLKVNNFTYKGKIEWLNKFKNTLDIHGNSIQFEPIDNNPQLCGTLILDRYTDNDLIINYKREFPGMTILQPEYTLICTDASISNPASITNLDNNTGYGTPNNYKMSGHIEYIINNCHRYLGKVIKGKQGTLASVKIHSGNTKEESCIDVLNPDGTMLLYQLDDSDSRKFASGESSTLYLIGGSEGLPYGDVMTKIPGFWYKGINLIQAFKGSLVTKSMLYTAINGHYPKDYLFEKSSEIKEIEVKYHGDITVDELHDGYSVLFNKVVAIHKDINTSVNINEYILEDTKNYIYKVDVEGYKKIRFPVNNYTENDLHIASCFVDSNGLIMADNNGNTLLYGKFICSTNSVILPGMYTIVSVPQGSKYFYCSVPKYTSSGQDVYPDSIVMHKGTNYLNTKDMDDAVKDWIADMEPHWNYSPDMCLSSALCSCYEDFIKSAFNGPAIIYLAIPNLYNKSFASKKYQLLAYVRGLSLMDYESVKIIAMLFMAKYGTRDSQSIILNAGLANPVTGGTAMIGMQDTTQQVLGSIGTRLDYSNILGLENWIGILNKLLYGLYSTDLVGTNKSLCYHVIINPDNTTRFVLGSSYSYVSRVLHGRYCDILALTSNGASNTCYTDYQTLLSTYPRTLDLVSTYKFSNIGRDPQDGVFNIMVNTTYNLPNSLGYCRALFRGNMQLANSIDEYINCPYVGL